MNFYGDMPDSHNLVVNISHPLIKKILEEKESKLSGDFEGIKEKLSFQEKEKEALNKLKEGKKDDEVPQEEKDKLAEVEKEIAAIEESKRNKLEEFGKSSELTKELIDLALLGKNMLTGEELNRFINRSINLLK
jgi:molecular chaperone HtpG